MRRSLRLAAPTIAAALLAAPATLAAQVTVSGIASSFSNATTTGSAPATITTVGTLSRVAFGTGATTAGPSRIEFQPAATPFDLTPGAGAAVFAIGTLTHVNNPILSGNGLTGVDLAVALTITGVTGPFTETFRILLDETPNSGCTPLPSCTDDILTFGQGNNAGNPITVGGTSYFLNILGFSRDNGATILSGFRSPESTSNSAQLYAELSPVPVGVTAAPEPATVTLLAGGLALALAAARRRRAA